MDTPNSLSMLEFSTFPILPSSISKSPIFSPNLSRETSRQRVDVLSDLYLSGCPMIAKKILSLLSPADLTDCLQVCKTWNHQVSSDSHLMGQVNSYRSECKANAENLYKTFEHMTVVPSERKALALISTNTAIPVRTKLAPTIFQPFPNGVTHMLCPTPAKMLNLRKVEQDHVVKRSPKRPREPEAICGTKKSKKRLRRL